MNFSVIIPICNAELYIEKYMIWKFIVKVSF